MDTRSGSATKYAEQVYCLLQVIVKRICRTWASWTFTLILINNLAYQTSAAHQVHVDMLSSSLYEFSRWTRFSIHGLPPASVDSHQLDLSFERLFTIHHVLTNTSGTSSWSVLRRNWDKTHDISLKMIVFNLVSECRCAVLRSAFVCQTWVEISLVRKICASTLMRVLSTCWIQLTYNIDLMP